MRLILIVFDLLREAPRRVCTAWARMLCSWPPPPLRAVRLQVLRQDLDSSGTDSLLSLCHWVPDFGPGAARVLLLE